MSQFEEAEESEEEKPLNPMNINWYFAFRAVEEFFDKHGRLPGVNDDSWEKDGTELVEIQTNLYKKMNCDKEIVEPCLKEM